jgi:hypothetical protein
MVTGCVRQERKSRLCAGKEYKDKIYGCRRFKTLPKPWVEESRKVDGGRSE